MGLTKPNQQLRRELRDAAARAEDQALAVWGVAQSLSSSEQAIALLGAMAWIYETADQLRALSERVKAGKVRVEM